MKTKYENITNDEFTAMVMKAIEAQGRRMSWIAEQLDVYPQTVRNKVNGATQWSRAERMLLESLLNL